MYSVYALLCHLPRVLIKASDIPASAADVAAPILKLCPVYWAAAIPPASNALLSSVTRRSLVRNFPFLNLNNGPSPPPLNGRYPRTAESGRKSIPVLPRCKVTPFRKGSVLDAFMRTSITCGSVLLSILTSESSKCTWGSYDDSDGATASPDLKNPKKHKEDAAHNIAVSCDVPCDSHTCFKILISMGVIGSLVRVPFLVVFRFRPLRTYSSWGMSPIFGSPRPRAIWVCLTAAK